MVTARAIDRSLKCDQSTWCSGLCMRPTLYDTGVSQYARDNTRFYGTVAAPYRAVPHSWQHVSNYPTLNLIFPISLYHYASFNRCSRYAQSTRIIEYGQLNIITSNDDTVQLVVRAIALVDGQCLSRFIYNNVIEVKASIGIRCKWVAKMFVGSFVLHATYQYLRDNWPAPPDRFRGHTKEVPTSLLRTIMVASGTR